MATPDNYFPETNAMSPAERMQVLMHRLQHVVEGSELIRKECNRIRNEFLGLGVPIDEEFLGLLAHLQIDVVHLRVKFARMSGLKGEQFTALLRHLENPMSQLDNEDPA